MKAELIEVYSEQVGKRQEVYRRLLFKATNSDKDGKKKVYFCDVVYGFRNYPRWKVVMQHFEERGQGIIVGQLTLKDAKHIDADSWPILLRK